MTLTIRRFALALLMAAFAGLPAAVAEEAPAKPGPGDPAPAFTAPDLDGKTVSLAELTAAGKVVVLNFWGLRCGSCIEEIGYLNPLAGKYEGRGVAFLGVNVDGVKAEVIRQMMPKMPNTPRYTVLPDPAFTIPDLYNMTAAPLTFVIGREGRVLYRHEDFKAGDEKELEEVVLSLVGGK